MSVRVIEQVWKTSHQQGGSLLVLLALADFADDEGVAYPSVETLAKKVRRSERTVHRIVAGLVMDKELRVERAPGRVNHYRVLMNGVTPASPLTRASPLTPATPTPDIPDTPPLTPVSPRTVIEPSVNRETGPTPKISADETLCPTGPHTFSGSYSDHLENDPRHKVNGRHK